MTANTLTRSLWRIYNRQAKPLPFTYGGNLPWDEPTFAQRMLVYHLSEDDNAASRVSAERAKQINWLWQTLNLAPQQHLLDVACGPGLYAIPLAQHNLTVHGIDFSSVALDYARQLAADAQVTTHCQFQLADMRTATYAADTYDAALLLYGQLAVMTSQEAQTVLNEICAALRPGGTLCLELLNPDHVDKKESTWWFTDDGQLWGDAPYLHLGERFWDATQQISTERFQILHLDSGRLEEIILCDQVYSAETITTMLKTAGFSTVAIHPAWDAIGLYDQQEWIVYIATK